VLISVPIIQDRQMGKSQLRRDALAMAILWGEQRFSDIRVHG